MRTDADNPARVRDPAIELLLSHTATLTESGGWSTWPAAELWVDRSVRQDAACGGVGVVRGVLGEDSAPFWGQMDRQVLDWSAVDVVHEPVDSQ
jgi:hypothetical protein